MSQDQDEAPPLYPENPCLSRLFSAIQTRDGVALDPDLISFSAPRVVPRMPDGSNTAVDVIGPGGPVTVWYERLDLKTLAEQALRIRVGFAPATASSTQILAALTAYFKRSLAAVDIEAECFDLIEEAPNGTFLITLRATVTSYGWFGKVDVVLDPIMELAELTRVRGLSSFQYTPPVP